MPASSRNSSSPDWISIEVERQHRQRYARMSPGERRGQNRHGRKRSGHHAQAEPADESLPEPTGLLLEALGIGGDSLRPRQHPLAFRGEPLESLAALHHEQPELLLELLDAGGERRLGHVARRGGAGKVALAGEHGQVLQMSEEHASAAILRAGVKAGNGPLYV